MPVDEKKPGNGAPLVGILKNGNSASNGSIKRNGDVPVGQIETRIEEVDEEQEQEQEQQQHLILQQEQEGEKTSPQSTETSDTEKQHKPNETDTEIANTKDETQPKKQDSIEKEITKDINTTNDNGNKIYSPLLWLEVKKCLCQHL